MAHPSFCKDPECELSYAAHMSFHVAAAARPTSGKALSVRRTEATEKGWDKDMPAYKRLRKQGYQPPRIDGAHKLEATAVVPEHVNMGSTHIKPASFREFADRAGHSATTPAQDAA